MKLNKNKMIHRMSFGMWVSITVMAAGIALLFWLVLGTSLRVGYRDENLRNLDKVTWAAMKKYGEADFENNLRFIAGSESYFIHIFLENQLEPLLALNSQGGYNTSEDAMVPENLFALMDEHGGYYSYYTADASGNTEWAVEAVVLANIEGSRQVLVVSKSLANVEFLLDILNNRVLFALAVVLVIASVLSLILTRRFAGPIDRLTQKAGLMVQGNYKVDFPKGGYYEVAQLSETLEMAANEFQATEELRREFIANISHDMKTPLTVIKMYAEMIQTVSGDHKEKREVHLERILNEVEKLTGFINDTMDLAKLQSRTWELKPETFNLSVLIDSALESFVIHKELEAFELQVEVDQSLYVTADRQLISRVLGNYISNAIKFTMEQKKIHIYTSEDDGIVKVCVQDYGTGIDAEDIAYVWDRYYKVNPYDKNKSGTGLGLHIVKEIMEMHEMPYGVESAVGKGSCFWFGVKAVKK